MACSRRRFHGGIGSRRGEFPGPERPKSAARREIFAVRIGLPCIHKLQID